MRTVMWRVRMRVQGDADDHRTASVSVYPGFEAVLAQMTASRLREPGLVGNADQHGCLIDIRVQAADALHAGIEAARVVDRASAVCGVPHWPVTALEVTAD